MTARYFALRAGALSTIVLLAACGGGGGARTMLPPVQGPSTGGSSAQAVAFSIAIPTATASSTLRRTRYISAGTKSAVIVAGGATTTVNCAQTCAATLSLIPGQVSIGVALYDGSSGSGNQLAHGATTATIVSGQSNTVSIAFDGVPSTVAVALGNSTVTAGSATTIPVTVTVKDAAGYTIVGNQSYASPIVLSDDDATGATSLSTTTVTAPATAVTLAFNGSASFTSANVTATVSGTAISARTTLGANAPPAAVPSHVATWYYYGLNDVNIAVSASFMAAHADYVEDDGYAAAHALAFKNAGGKYAAAYTDPAYVPYCNAPFTVPAGWCGGPIGDLVAHDESAWFHAADGTRIYRADGKYYQEALNPAAPSARNAYASTTASIVAASPKLDYFFADDSGGPWYGPDGTTMTGWFWAFNLPGVEVASESAFVTAEKQMLAAAARPVFVNGADPETMQPAEGGAWLDAPNVSGASYEGCFSDGNGVAGTNKQRWVLQSNALITNYAHRSKAICMLMADATPANRIYDMASWWMTYDPALSIVAPMNPVADGTTVLQEYDVVPTQPLTTATTSIAQLARGTNVYVREFGACYQARTAIGPCAAIVNTGSTSVALPALRGHYTAALSVDAAGAYAGGKANWTGPVPASLGALSAAIVR